jgi:sec-independent protein translocase protein TatA
MVGDILQPTHLLLILVVALLVLGPKRLPEAGQALGKGLRDFRMAMSGDQQQHHSEIATQAPPPPPTVSAPAPVVATPHPESAPVETVTAPVAPAPTTEFPQFEGERTSAQAPEPWLDAIAEPEPWLDAIAEHATVVAEPTAEPAVEPAAEAAPEPGADATVEPDAEPAEPARTIN